MNRSSVSLSDGVQIELMEWSGSGPPMIFLAGLTHTAHCMGYLASHFLAEYNCVGITRRGFGGSSKGPIDYSLERLVKDIQEVCKARDITDAVFVGHSFGCLEIERLTDRDPDLVKACILLDGAYDSSGDAEFIKDFRLSPAPGPSKAELDSIQGMGTYTSRILGVRLPVEELAEIYSFAADGSCLGQAADEKAVATIMTEVRVPDWQLLQQPILAIFAKPNAWEVYAPGVVCQSNAEQKEFSRFFDAMTNLKERQITEFAKALPEAHIARPEYSNHYLHLSHEWLVVKLIKNFLESE